MEDIRVTCPLNLLHFLHPHIDTKAAPPPSTKLRPPLFSSQYEAGHFECLRAGGEECRGFCNRLLNTKIRPPWKPGLLASAGEGGERRGKCKKVEAKTTCFAYTTASSLSRSVGRTDRWVSSSDLRPPRDPRSQLWRRRRWSRVFAHLFISGLWPISLAERERESTISQTAGRRGRLRKLCCLPQRKQHTRQRRLKDVFT